MNKQLLNILALLTLALLVPNLRAHEETVAGPNGGRVLEKVQPHAEFFVTPERKVQITFLDGNGQPVAPSGQVVRVTAGQRSAPTHLTFARQGDVLVSNEPLPEGNLVPTVVQIKASPGAPTVTERFNVNLAKCPECGLGEYACTCH